MNTTSESRGFYIGLAIGQIWLSLISTGFVSILWIFGQNPEQVALILAGVGLVGLILLGTSLTLMRRALYLPRDSSPEDIARSRAIGRKFGRRFGLIVLAEVVIIGAINVMLGQTHHDDWIVPVTYFIVGLHFIPLAFVFQVRPYTVLGLLWLLIILLTVIFTPPGTTLGQDLSVWILFPIAGCGLATWVVTAYILTTNINRINHALPLPA